MNSNFNTLIDNLVAYHDSNANLVDLDIKLYSYVYKLVINDVKDKNISNFHEWLNYYSCEYPDLYDIAIIVQSYRDKAVRNDHDSITLLEKIVITNAVAIYSIEMDIDIYPEGDLLNRIIATFIETVIKFHKFKRGYLELSGVILISNRSLFTFEKIDMYAPQMGVSIRL